MAKVKFLADYQGVKTPGHFFYSGQVVELEDEAAVEGLLDMGRVELFEEPKPAPKPKAVSVKKPAPKAAPKKAPAKK